MLSSCQHVTLLYCQDIESLQVIKLLINCKIYIFQLLKSVKKLTFIAKNSKHLLLTYFFPSLLLFPFLTTQNNTNLNGTKTIFNESEVFYTDMESTTTTGRMFSCDFFLHVIKL